MFLSGFLNSTRESDDIRAGHTKLLEKTMDACRAYVRSSELEIQHSHEHHCGSIVKKCHMFTMEAARPARIRKPASINFMAAGRLFLKPRYRGALPQCPRRRRYVRSACVLRRNDNKTWEGYSKTSGPVFMRYSLHKTWTFKFMLAFPLSWRL